MRDDTMSELVALRERSAELHNDLEAIDRTLCAMGFEGELEGQADQAKPTGDLSPQRAAAIPLEGAAEGRTALKP